MELMITRLASDDRRYSIVSSNINRYGVQAQELKTWLLNLGLGASKVAYVLEIEPNETAKIQIAKAA